MGAAVPTSQRPAVSRRGPSLPSVSDIMIATSTVPGHVSWRSSARGSYFIQDLCQVIYINGILRIERLPRIVGAVVIKWQKKQSSDSDVQNTNTFQANLDTLTLPVIPPRSYIRICLCMQRTSQSFRNFNIKCVWRGICMCVSVYLFRFSWKTATIHIWRKC